VLPPDAIVRPNLSSSSHDDEREAELSLLDEDVGHAEANAEFGLTTDAEVADAASELALEEDRVQAAADADALVSAAPIHALSQRVSKSLMP
jgi:hypothetical protein